MPEERDSTVPAHSPPTGTCVTVSLFLSWYEIKWAVNRVVEVMVAHGTPGRRLDINQSDAARAAGGNPRLSPPDVGHP